MAGKKIKDSDQFKILIKKDTVCGGKNVYEGEVIMAKAKDAATLVHFGKARQVKEDEDLPLRTRKVTKGDVAEAKTKAKDKADKKAK